MAKDDRKKATFGSHLTEFGGRVYSPFDITFASLSEVGGRSGNEDFICCESNGREAFFAVADGLGGHGKGEVASQLAVEHALAAFRGREGELGSEGSADAWFTGGQEAILLAQERIDARNEMKTTLVCLAVEGFRAQWGHIGDSRLYWFVNGRLEQRTLDHSVPQMLVLSGEITEKDIRHHEDRNRLLRVMGSEWGSNSYEVAKRVTLAAGDSFLLCTDGFWEHIDERAMQRCLRQSDSAEAWLDAMLAIAAEDADADTRDNYSAIAVFIR